MAVTIRGKTLPLPFTGGMGVGISLDGLAGAVAACGGMGTLSTAVCVFRSRISPSVPLKPTSGRWTGRFAMPRFWPTARG